MMNILVPAHSTLHDKVFKPTCLHTQETPSRAVYDKGFIFDMNEQHSQSAPSCDFFL